MAWYGDPASQAREKARRQEELEKAKKLQAEAEAKRKHDEENGLVYHQVTKWPPGSSGR